MEDDTITVTLGCQTGISNYSEKEKEFSGDKITTYNVHYQPFFLVLPRPLKGKDPVQKKCPHCDDQIELRVSSHGRVKKMKMLGKAAISLFILCVLTVISIAIFAESLDTYLPIILCAGAPLGLFSLVTMLVTFNYRAVDIINKGKTHNHLFVED